MALALALARSWPLRLHRVVCAAWFGALACIAFVSAPAPFALLSRADAGRVNGLVFEREAWISLVLAVALLLVERRRSRVGGGPALSADALLLLGSAFCTVAGYYAIQPLLVAARAGGTVLSFGQLHGLSVGFFGLKLLLIGLLAWRAAAS